jgi:Protein of unknown function (DUF2281)
MTETSKLMEIHQWEEVPDFKSEAEEADFWSTHCLGDELLEQMEPLPEGILPLPRSQPVKSQLMEILDYLPEELLIEVRDFAEFLQQKNRKRVG